MRNKNIFKNKDDDEKSKMLLELSNSHLLSINNSFRSSMKISDWNRNENFNLSEMNIQTIKQETDQLKRVRNVSFKLIDHDDD